MSYDESDEQCIDPITGKLYEETINSMKEILDLGQFKIGDKNSREYAYFKSKVMDSVYNKLQNYLDYLEEEEIIQKCPYCITQSIRKGWKSCTCRGSGYVTKEDILYEKD